MKKIIKKPLLIFFLLVSFIVLFASYKAYKYSSNVAAELSAKLESGKNFSNYPLETIEFVPSENKMTTLLPLPIFPIFGKVNEKKVVISTTLKDFESGKIDLKQSKIILNVYKNPKKEDTYLLSHPSEMLAYIKTLSYFDFVIIFIKSFGKIIVYFVSNLFN